ncbi:hypothetical protein AK812_SmicGene6613 [Symbiodinium microadriaticum]|uniref:Uncharacterized protein n=1 Tax=Symbiodinium microadriaticum TaxID=2951 RepID=A0A1Q9EQQ9_SYMMI|nr:hypothetical protein AK812_SmicGene6613 [Symbiodinium microadriaticum]
MFAYSGCVRVAEGFISRFQQQEAPCGSLGPGGSAGFGGAGGFGGGSGSGGYAGAGPGGEPQLPQEWLDADAARAADDRAVELAQMEAERTGRKFEDVANMDTDDIADDPYALLPRPIFLTQTEFVGPEGTTVGWPPKGATDKWGGSAGPVCSLPGWALKGPAGQGLTVNSLQADQKLEFGCAAEISNSLECPGPDQ